MLYKNFFLTIAIFSYGNSVPIYGGDDVGKVEMKNNQQVVVTGQEKFPFMAHLTIVKKRLVAGIRREITGLCGGVIISKDAILTAAHCLTNSMTKPMVHVQVGLVHTQYERLLTPSIWAEDFVINEGYVASYDVSEDLAVYAMDDLAIVWLETPLKFGPTVQKIDFIKSDYISPGTAGLILGWGITESGKKSPMLQEGYTRVILNAQCKAQSGNVMIMPDMFCVMSVFGTVSACDGDSGGPFISNGLLYGISSFGFSKDSIYGEQCDPSKPQIFINIGSFREWIAEKFDERRKLKTSKDIACKHHLRDTTTPKNKKKKKVI